MLKEITKRLLCAEYPCEKMRAAQEMHALFSGITKVGDASRNAEDKRETLAVGGKAISPNDAARCMFDYMRTVNFLGGVRAAVIEARRRFPDQTIHILYAGCGPFATLALPLTTEFSSDEVNFTLLDIHQRSLDAARLIVERLGLHGFVRDYIQCDAACYKHPHEDAPHIVVTETMQKALTKEPQVAITANLAPQLRAGGILIPQKITLSACLADLSREITMTDADSDSQTPPLPNRSRIELGKVFELTATGSQRVSEWQRERENDGTPFFCSPPVILHVPRLAVKNYALMVLTEITIFDSIRLGDYDCGLTYPTVLEDLGRMSGGERIEFRYATGRHPGLRYRLL